MSERSLTDPHHTFVIAEAGVNHNGDVGRALELVDAAAQAGADAVKFQTFKAEKLVSASAPKAEYALRATDREESQLDMLRKLEVDEDGHRRINERCKARSIEFMSTPFDAESAGYLVETFNVRRLKIPSGEIVNPLLLVAAARTARPMIVSTGMSTLPEIEQALGVIAFGYGKGKNPSTAAFSEAFASDEGRDALARNVILLHCTTEYPAPLEAVNLHAMKTLADNFGLPVGYSDHTQGITVPVAAVALGAVVVEKHFSLDRALPGPDHAASLEPDELAAMVQAIRDTEIALGGLQKQVTPIEAGNRDVARGSLVAARDIAAGSILEAADLTVKRPGTGVSPFCYWDYVGQPASRNFAVDEMIE